MSGKVNYLLMSILWLVYIAQSKSTQTEIVSLARVVVVYSSPVEPHYTKSLRFNVYTFAVTATDTGRVRDVVIKVYRGALLLTNFRIRVDGAIAGAEVADLDNNRFPELYIYSTTNGSGSFGRVYAWQFLPERKADISLPNWRLSSADGYMGHDSMWVDRAVFCRKYPLYRPGDANAEPSGGNKIIQYKLKPAGTGFALIKEEVRR